MVKEPLGRNRRQGAALPPRGRGLYADTAACGGLRGLITRTRAVDLVVALGQPPEAERATRIRTGIVLWGANPVGATSKKIDRSRGFAAVLLVSAHVRDPLAKSRVGPLAWQSAWQSVRRFATALTPFVAVQQAAWRALNHRPIST